MNNVSTNDNKLIFMSENTRGRCPVASTPNKDVTVILVASKSQIPYGAQKLPEFSNETWSHYEREGVKYGYKKKLNKKYF